MVLNKNHHNTPWPYCRCLSAPSLPTGPYVDPDKLIPVPRNVIGLLGILILLISTLLLQTLWVLYHPQLLSMNFLLTPWHFSCFFPHTSEVFRSLSTKALACENQWDRSNSHLLLTTLLLKGKYHIHTRSHTCWNPDVLPSIRQKPIILCFIKPWRPPARKLPEVFVKIQIPGLCLRLTGLKISRDRGDQEFVFHWFL